jgi:hypothetical protein
MGKAPNSISDFHAAIGQELALLQRDSTPHATYRIAESDAFRNAVLAGVGKALNA